MKPQHVPAIQKLVCTNIPVTSRLGQALCRGGYSVDGFFLNKDEALAWTIIQKQTELVKDIVKDGVNIDLRTGPSQTAALHVAAYVGSCEIISILKDAGASLKEKDVSGFTTLHYAAYNGRHEAAELLCDLGADTKCRSNDRSTPLHGAARGRSTKIIQLLFDRNFDVDCRDDNEITPLLVASMSGEIRTVQLLVKLGADAGLQDKAGNTPIHHAAKNDHTTLVEYLIGLGAELTVINNYGYNVLSVAALGKAQHVADLILQLENVDVNQQDRPSVIVPLISAARSGSFEIACLLVQNGALLEVTDDNGNTPLHTASTYGHPEVARFLLEKGANIESRNISQQTPFLFAAFCGEIGMVRLLAEYGADLEAKDSDGCCALHYAAANTNDLLLRCLLNLAVDIEVKLPNGAMVLEFATLTGKTDIASALLHFGASTTTKVEKKYTVLQPSANDQLIACAKYGNMTQMTRLLDEGVDINALSTSGRSALSVAAEYGYPHLINLVLERGGLLDVQDSNGETALWWASQCDHIEVVQRLLELGAQVGLPNSDGNSPLCVACQKGYMDIAEHLLEAGSDPNTTTNYGMTPLLLAVNADQMGVVGLLIDKGGVAVEQVVQAVQSSNRPGCVVNITRYLCDSFGSDHLLNHLGLDKNLQKAVDSASPPKKGKVVYGNQLTRPVTPQQSDTNSADDCSDPIYGDQLAIAASDDLVAEMLRLIKAGANINGTSRAAVPLLHAADQNHERAVQVLIENGAQIDSVDEDGYTALCFAAGQGNKAIIDLLCKHHANIEHKTLSGSTPLVHAVVGEHIDAVKTLLDRGAKIGLSDGNPVDSLRSAILQGAEHIIEILPRNGAKVKTVDRMEFTPLLYAVKKGKWNVTEILLKNGARLDIVPGSKISPLLMAISSGQAAIVELLAKYGADIHRLGKYDQSPLIYAAQLGKDMVVQSLIDIGANLDGKDYRGRTALSYAKEKGLQSTVKLLLQAQSLRRDGRYVKKAEEQRRDPKTSFEYRPLSKGSIRVLELQPGQKGNVVSFSLIHVELSKPPSFEALSYEWKGKIGTVPTRCDGERILVTPNCYAALEILRSETETRILWIDAICINQQDTLERGIQVSMMYDIFSKATSVLMWVGEEEDDSDLAFDSIPALSRAMEEIQKSPGFTDTTSKQVKKDLLLERPEIQDLTEQPKVATETWETWYELYRRSYFTRAWIFQEIILAGPRGEVMCGTRQCSWDTFKSALQAYTILQMDFDDSLEAIMNDDKDFRSERYLRLDSALWAMSSFKAGDLRDKVFAALGLAFGNGKDHQAWGPLRVPKVDYSKSVEEAFISANRYIISCYGDDSLWSSLDPINQSPPTGGKKSLPSWAFDFRKPALFDFNPFPENDMRYTTWLPGRPTTTQSSLHVNGYEVDTVYCKVPIAKDKSTVDVVKTVVRYVAGLGRSIYGLSPSIGNPSVQSGSHEDLGKSYSRTNLAALLRTLMTLDGCSANEEMNFATYVAWQLMTDNGTSQSFKTPPDFLRVGIETWRQLSHELANFDLAVCKNMESQHRYEYDLVYTKKGHFGLAPSLEGEEGLLMTVIGGCKDLVLLRRKGSSKDTWYEYVSKVYMYDWTKDKIKTSQDLGDDLKQVRFEIRLNFLERFNRLIKSEMSVEYAEPVEQLFLDLSVNQVLQRDGVQVVEPWASQYVDAIQDTRYGNAIWARYHIFGEVVDGSIEGLTVLESITQDAMGYKKHAPEQYAEAVSFYKGTSSVDGHTDVIEVILRVDGEDLTGKYIPESG
ncbi:ankyrin repeat [Fusarium sporotrichioides]|uniref:Ankyrin repeat n=1 Tax=Fusarium sporotrichioides TaxID=5514 RepID=A0A395SH50_FUSSP|nr:ankyrin repeat [Fusarium sporotrichioides]